MRINKPSPRPMLTEHARGADYKFLTKLLEPSIATWVSRDQTGSRPVLLHEGLRDNQGNKRHVRHGGIKRDSRCHCAHSGDAPNPRRHLEKGSSRDITPLLRAIAPDGDYTPVDPNLWAPRLVSGNFFTCRTSALAHCSMISCATRSPTATSNGELVLFTSMT